MAKLIITPQVEVSSLNLSQQWDKIFPLSPQVLHQKVTFRNRYGITLAGDLYVPATTTNDSKLPAVAVSGPFGAVKEQASGLHAHQLAQAGFVALAFDQSFTGESGGQVRDVASPEIFTEDFSAAIDFLGLQSFVDRNRIGVLGICGLAGMAITAATADARIKAVAVTAMYDMSRSITRGYLDSYTSEQQEQLRQYIATQRWADVDAGNNARGWHELVVLPDGNILSFPSLLPPELPADAPEVAKQFFSYYKTDRGYHPRSINSNTAWTATTPMAFWGFDLMTNLERYQGPLLAVTGSKAHSAYFMDSLKERMVGKQQANFIVVPEANHVDLYDQQAPFAEFVSFFSSNL